MSGGDMEEEEEEYGEEEEMDEWINSLSNMQLIIDESYDLTSYIDFNWINF